MTTQTPTDEDKKKKLTETEQLKLNTRIEKAKQQAEEIGKFLIVRNRMVMHFRAKALKVMFAGLLMLAVSIVGDIVGWMWLEVIGWVLWLASLFGFVICDSISTRAQGEFDGAWEMLVLLGHAEDDEPKPPKKRKRVKKKSMFARPKEFWERMTKSKEAYSHRGIMN